MGSSKKYPETIAQLKQVREERNLTYNDILHLVDEAGGFVSLTTVRRVFAKGSEHQNFRYYDSIQPLKLALLDTVPEEEPAPAVAGESELNLYKELLDKENKKLQAAIRQLDHAQADFRKKDLQIVILFIIICVLLLVIAGLLSVGTHFLITR
jgi:hypothetical protein